MKKIKTNKVKCLVCEDIVESKHGHDFVWCKCGNIAVDGGKNYLKRMGGLNQYEDLSEFEKCEKCGSCLTWRTFYKNENDKWGTGRWDCIMCAVYSGSVD